MEKDVNRRAGWNYWITTLILVAISTVGWMRFQQALRHWYYLIDLNLWPHPLYLAASGGLTGIAFAAGLLLHLLKATWTAVYLRIIGILLTAWLWVDRIFIGIRESFTLLLAGTIVISICLVCADLFFFQRNAYLKEKSYHATED